MIWYMLFSLLHLIYDSSYSTGLKKTVDMFSNTVCTEPFLSFKFCFTAHWLYLIPHIEGSIGTLILFVGTYQTQVRTAFDQMIGEDTYADFTILLMLDLACCDIESDIMTCNPWNLFLSNPRGRELILFLRLTPLLRGKTFIWEIDYKTGTKLYFVNQPTAVTIQW